MIALILETIDKCSQWKSMRHLAHLIGEDSAAKWNDMINYLYLLLGMSAAQSVSKNQTWLDFDYNLIILQFGLTAFTIISGMMNKRSAAG